MTYLHTSPYQYNDDDIVDFNKINLQYEYNKVNNECFNNQLPKVPLVWTKTKSPLGRVKSIRYRLTGEKKIINLAITTFYEMTYKLFKSTMAHEMIHVKLITDNDHIHETLRIQHGSSFKSEMNRINNLNLGYEIEIRSTAEIPVSSQLNSKDLVVLIFNKNNTYDYSITVTSPKTYRYYIASILDIFRKLIKHGKYSNVEIRAVETNDNRFLAYPITRSFERNIPQYHVSDNDLDFLLRLNPILYKNINKHSVDLIENTTPNSSSKQENILPEISKSNGEYDVVINY